MTKGSPSRRRDDEEILVGSKHSFANSQQRKYVKCGFCSGFYLKGSISHSSFLKQSDSIFGNSSRRSSTIKSHNVFCYDIESRLENYFECKVERPELIGEDGRVILERKQMRKTFFASDELQVEDFRSNLNDKEMKFLTVSKCQSHQLTLLCVVNELILLRGIFARKNQKVKVLY